MQTVLRYNTPLVTANKGLSLRARAITNTNRLEVCIKNNKEVMMTVDDYDVLLCTAGPKKILSIFF